MNDNPVKDQPPQARSKHPRVIFSLVVLAIVPLAALLNPSQARHFEEIDKIIQRRQLSLGDTASVAVLASYNNYFLFSTVTFGHNHVMDDSRILSYGFLGTVKTSGNIQTVMFAIYEWAKTQKKKE
jgi:hypothetical protein